MGKQDNLNILLSQKPEHRTIQSTCLNARCTPGTLYALSQNRHPTLQRGHYSYLPFTDKETEAQRGLSNLIKVTQLRAGICVQVGWAQKLHKNVVTVGCAEGQFLFCSLQTSVCHRDWAAPWRAGSADPHPPSRASGSQSFLPVSASVPHSEKDLCELAPGTITEALVFSWWA